MCWLQEVPNVGDLDDSMAAVHAQLAGLTSAISDLTGSSQELIMTSTGDGLEAHEGKVIRIVSLGQDGSVLSLGDGSQMQIMSEDDLQGSADIKVWAAYSYVYIYIRVCDSVCAHIINKIKTF